MSEAQMSPGAESTPLHSDATSLPSWGRVMLFAMLAGLVAGALACLGGEAIRDIFKPAHIKPQSPFSNENELAQLAAIAREARYAFLILGGAMGLVMGLAGGLARGAWRSALGAGVVGMLLGGVAAFGLSAILIPIASANGARMVDDLGFSIAVLGGVWAPLGLIGGLAFGLGLGHGLRGPIFQGATGGLVGALFGTATFLLVGAILFPLAKTGTPLSMDWIVRALARISVTFPAALLAGRSAYHGLVAERK